MKQKLKKRLLLEMDGIEPIITIERVGVDYKETKKIGFFYPFRRLRWKLECMLLKRDIIRRGYKPVRCEGCGEGWAEHSIEEPNQRIGTWKRIFVCRGCVSFYDWKWTNKPLYKDVEDFRR